MEIEMTKKPLSLTEDKVSTALLRFALPFFLANLLHSLYGAVDLLIIGRYCSPAHIAAVSTGTQIMTTLFSVVIGLSTGATVLIGQSVGEGNGEKAAHAVGSSAFLSLIVALVITPPIIIFASPVIALMQTPAEAVGYAWDYLVICAAGIPFMLGYNAVGGIYRGVGDSKTPMYFVAITSCVNLVADILLVGVFRLGAAGAAYATTFSEILSFLIALFFIRRKELPFKIERRHFRPSGKAIGYILKVGIPLSLQEALVSFSFMLITAFVNAMGVIMSAAVGIVEKIMMFTMMPPMAFSSAVTTMTAQNMGANKPDRALKSLRYGIAYSLIFGLAVCVFSQISPQTLTSIFAVDEDVIAMAASYLRTYSFDCILICFIFAMNSYFNGCGKSMVTFVHSMVATFGVRVPICKLAVKYCVGTLWPMGIGAPIASCVSLAICAGYFIWLRKRSATPQPKI